MWGQNVIAEAVVITSASWAFDGVLSTYWPDLGGRYPLPDPAMVDSRVGRYIWEVFPQDPLNTYGLVETSTQTYLKLPGVP